MLKAFTNQQLAYFLARLALGVNLLLHGFVRLPKLSGFVSGMEKQFFGSMIPGFLVTPMAWLIPPVELVLGAMLILGLWTRAALIGSAVLMIVLISGCCLIENWSAVGSQMVYVLFICLLIYRLDDNRGTLRD